MNAMNHCWFVVRRCALILAALGLAACSGGGGGGDGGGVQPVSYVGNLDSATITDTNAQPLAGAAVSGGSIGGSLAGGAMVSSSPDSGESYLTKVAVALRKSLARPGSAPPVASGTHLNDSGTDPCLFNGSVTTNVTVDDANGNFNGTVRFSSCSDFGGETISGSMSITGHISGATTPYPQIDTLTANGTLSYADSAGTFAFTGTLAMTFAYPTTTSPDPDEVSVVANVDARNSGSGIYIRLINFTLTAMIASSYEEDSVSGTVCHSVAGCVTVSTITPLRFYGSDPWPSSGQIVVRGTTNNSSARLTAVDSTYYNLEWDTGGDGTYEGSLMSQPWPTLG